MFRVALFALVGLISCTGSLAADPVTAVPELDAARYLGQWFEIARLPQYYQNNCSNAAGTVTATYSLNDDGTVKVHNVCEDKNQVPLISDGKAKIPNPDEPAKLKVTFASDEVSDNNPFVWANYWVCALDEDYQWALVLEPSRTFLWILSRKASLDEATFENVKSEAKRMGYSLNLLITSGTIE